MPHSPLTQIRKNTVKARLTPESPADWLLSQYDRQAPASAYPGLYDADGDPTVAIQPMFTLKSDTEATERMQVLFGDYLDPDRRPL
jgi:hypothetical protein